MLDDPLLRRACRILENNPVGMFLTVDAEGTPRGRWMGATLRLADRSLFTMTARQTRKLEQIAANPRVSWVFTAPDFSETATFLGRAMILDGPLMVRDAWDWLQQTGRTYAIGPFSDDDNLEMAVIQTVIERVELTCPELDAPTPRRIAIP